MGFRRWWVGDWNFESDQDRSVSCILGCAGAWGWICSILCRDGDTVYRFPPLSGNGRYAVDMAHHSPWVEGNPDLHRLVPLMLSILFSLRLGWALVGGDAVNAVCRGWTQVERTK